VAEDSEASGVYSPDEIDEIERSRIEGLRLSASRLLGSGFASALVALAAAVIVIAGMKAAQALVVPFMLALFLAIIGAPGVAWLRRHRVPAAVAVLIVVIVMLAVLTVVGAVVGGSINRFVAAIPSYQERLDGLVERIPMVFGRFNIEITEADIREVVRFGSVMNWVGTGLKGLAALVSNTFMIALIVVFMLLEGVWLPIKLKVAVGEQSALVLQLSHVATQIQRYLAVKTIVSLATGALVGILTAALGLDFALIWGLLAFLLNFIPTIGSLLASIPAVMLALVQIGPGTATAVALGYLAINVTFGNIIEPNVMGRTLGLSTLVVFLSLVFWGWVLGPVGMLLSVPLTMIIKIILESSESTRPIAIMLDNGRAAAARMEQEEPSPASG
jgi:predicted PurR-regulated permease PerM